jgi:hypothetical protein
VWTFTVAPQIIQNPIPVLPPSGANVHPRPTLTVMKATRSGPTGAMAYRFEAASGGPLDPTGVGVPAFDRTVVAAATVPEGGARTSWTVPFDLMIGALYYWRVQAIDIASGVTSTYSVMTVGGSISGTRGGTAAAASVPSSVYVSNANDNGAPARVSGTLGASGRMSGTFSGFLKASSSYAGYASCSAPDIGWTITPQQP